MEDTQAPGKWTRMLPKNADVWLNRFSNLAILLVAALAAVYVYGQGPRRGAVRSTPVEYKEGDILDLTKLKMKGPGLLLVSRSTCPACVESIPFYKGLHGISIIAVANEPIETNRDFLLKNGIQVSSLVSLEDSGLDVSFVPTLIAVTAEGRVVKTWRGKLSKKDESEVSRIVKGVSP